MAGGRRHHYVYEFSAETLKAVRAASEGRLSGMATFEDFRNGYIGVLEQSLKSSWSFMEWLRERNVNWKQTLVFVDGEFRPLVCEEAA